MENKTKVKVAVVIGIVILAVIFIFMVVFVKGNRPKKNKNIPTITNGYAAESNKNTTGESGGGDTEEPPVSTGEKITLDGIVSLATKNGSLVKVKSDFSSEEITKLGSGYSGYCYGDNKAYQVLDNEDGSYSIYEIDLLKSDYPQKSVLTTSDYGAIKNIDYYAGKLYFVSQSGQLIEYSISETYSRALTNENEVSSFVIDKVKNNMFVSYKPGGANAGVYILDFTSNSFTQIISLNDLAGDLMLNGNSLVIDVKDFATLYVYDINNATVVSIGADNYLEKAKDHIAFYDNVLLYTDGSNISLKDASGNSYKDNWYTLDDSSIASIEMLDSKTVQVARYGQDGKVSRSIIIDLSNGATTEVSDSAYTDVVRIN